MILTGTVYSRTGTVYSRLMYTYQVIFGFELAKQRILRKELSKRYSWEITVNSSSLYNYKKQARLIGNDHLYV